MNTGLIILTVLLSVIICVASVVIPLMLRKKRKENNMCNTAANSLIREQFLKYSLQNPNSNIKQHRPDHKKLMLYIKTKGSGKKQRYVFDPEEGVYIGRCSEKSNIYINDAMVSQEHCGIFLNNDNVYINDFNSSNGTIVRRGPFRKYNISGGRRLVLKSGDEIEAGSARLKVILFYFDMTLL